MIDVSSVELVFGRTPVEQCSVEQYKVRPNFLYFTSCRSFLSSTEHLFGRTFQCSTGPGVPTSINKTINKQFIFDLKVEKGTLLAIR